MSKLTLTMSSLGFDLGEIGVVLRFWRFLFLGFPWKVIVLKAGDERIYGNGAELLA